VSSRVGFRNQLVSLPSLSLVDLFFDHMESVLGDTVWGPSTAHGMNFVASSFAN